MLTLYYFGNKQYEQRYYSVLIPVTLKTKLRIVGDELTTLRIYCLNNQVMVKFDEA